MRTVVDVRLAQEVKDCLREIPSRGVGYGVLRYLDPDADVRRSLAIQNDVVFNYFGTHAPKAGLSRTRPLQLHRSSGVPRETLLEVNIGPEENQLAVRWTMRAEPKLVAAASRVAEAFGPLIEELVAFCTDEGADQVSASDFPLANLDEKSLSQLASLLKRKENGGASRQ